MDALVARVVVSQSVQERLGDLEAAIVDHHAGGVVAAPIADSVAVATAVVTVGSAAGPVSTPAQPHWVPIAAAGRGTAGRPAAGSVAGVTSAASRSASSSRSLARASCSVL